MKTAQTNGAAREINMPSPEVVSVRMTLPDTIQTIVTETSSLYGKKKQTTKSSDIPFSAVVMLKPDAAADVWGRLGIGHEPISSVTVKISEKEGRLVGKVEYDWMESGLRTGEVCVGSTLRWSKGDQIGPYSYAEEDYYEYKYADTTTPYSERRSAREEIPLSGPSFTQLYVSLHNAAAKGNAEAKKLLNFLGKNHSRSVTEAMNDVKATVAKMLEEAMKNAAQLQESLKNVSLPGAFRGAERQSQGKAANG